MKRTSTTYWRLGVSGPRGAGCIYVAAKTAEDARHHALTNCLGHGEQVVTVHPSREMEAVAVFLNQHLT